MDNKPNKKVLLLTIIKDMMDNKIHDITNNIIFNAIKTKYSSYVDPQIIRGDAKIIGTIEDEIRRTYSGSLKKVWKEIEDELKNERLTLERVGRKNTIYRFPEGMAFNPCENILARERKDVKNTIYEILKNSSALLPPSWISSLGLFIDEEDDAHQRMVQFDYTSTKNQELLPIVYDFIKRKKVISFKYQPFCKKPYWVRLIPYLLKQYNLRWFVCGRSYNKKNNQWQHTVFALDRIISDVCEIEMEYIDNDINYDDYFKDVVGTTVFKTNEAEDIIFRVEDSYALEYIRTKKIHSSQIVIKENIIKLHVRINYEIETKLFEFADRIVIEKPLSLKKKIMERAENVLKKC